MSIFIVIAPHPELQHTAWACLEQSGVVPAAPSRRELLAPSEIHGIMLKAAQQRIGAKLINGTAAAGQKAVTPALEKIWIELATDLMLANVDAADFGWHQSLDAYTPVFWHRFDPEARFVLVFEDPAAHVTRSLLNRKTSLDTDPDTLKTLLADWIVGHTMLLETFYALGTDAVLVHSSALKSMASLLGLSPEGNTCPTLAPNPSRLPAVLGPLVRSLVTRDESAHSLWLELQAAAQCPAREPDNECMAIFQSVCAIQALQAELGNTQQQRDALMQQAVSAEITAHQQETAAKALAQKHAEQLLQEKTRLTEQQCHAVRDGEQEAELLLAQLHQVQEELEQYLLKHQEQKHQLERLAEFWKHQAPGELWVDLRRTPNGNGWYEPEADGRWSGPGTQASIHFPSFAPGLYLVELHVADAVAAELVAAMKVTVEVPGSLTVPVDLVHEFGPPLNMFPMVSTGLLNLPDCISGWILHLGLPYVVCPAEHAGNDSRRLGLLLKGVRLSFQQTNPERVSA